MLVHSFIFPSFEDRTSDIHNITVFNKKSDEMDMDLSYDKYLLVPLSATSDIEIDGIR